MKNIFSDNSAHKSFCKMRFWRRCYFASILMYLLGSCASYNDHMTEVRSSFIGHHYDKALNQLEKSPVKQDAKSRLLYALEKARIYDKMGDTKKAREHLFQGDHIASELYTVKISKEIASWLVNDAQSDYSGEDYEIIAIHTLLALSYLQDKSLNEARVEAKSIEQKLTELSVNRDEKYRKYKEDGMARYLSGLVYEAKKNWDDSIIDYRRALQIFEDKGYKDFYYGAPPESLVRSLYRVAKQRRRTEILTELKSKYPEPPVHQEDWGSLVVIHEVGHISVKKAKDFVLPVGNQLIRFSYPVIYPGSMSPTRTGVEIDGVFYPGDHVANLSHIAHFSLEDKRGQMLLKNLTRLVAKAAATEAVNRNVGPLAGLAANVFSVVTETADTRCWSLLPESFYITRIDLKPGTYSVKVLNNAITSHLEEVVIEPQSFVFLRDL